MARSDDSGAQAPQHSRAGSGNSVSDPSVDQSGNQKVRRQPPVPPRSALLLINEKCSGASSDLTAVSEILETSGVRLSSERMDPARMAEVILGNRDRVDAVILGGGDGTIHHNLPALIRAELPLGVLPLGTANDLARTLQIPSDLGAAARVIGDGHRWSVDVGRVNQIPFLNAAHVGFGVQVTEQLTDDLKHRLGVWGYAVTAWKAWRRRRPFRIHLQVDEGTDLRIRALHVTVASGRHYGGGLTIAPDARIDDQQLDVIVIRPQGLYEMLGLVRTLRWGDRGDRHKLARASGRSVRLQTSTPRAVATDGEIRTRTPALFDLLPGALQVFVPPVRDASTRPRS